MNGSISNFKSSLKTSKIQTSNIERIEDDLLNFDTLFKTLVELSPDPIAIHRDNIFIYVNDACLKLIKANSKDDIIGKPITNIIHPNYHNNVFKRNQQAIDTNENLPIVEMKFVCFDGSIKDVEVTSKAFSINDNYYILAIAHNITSRKQTIEELAKSEEKYRNIFEQSRECIYFTKPDGRIIDINQSGCNILGWTKEEIQGINVYDLYVNPQDRTEALKILEKNGFTKDLEILLKRKDGTKIICLDTAVTWRDIEGNTIGYIGILQDITKRKVAEAENEKLIYDLKKSKEALEKETTKVKKLNANLLTSQKELKENIATKDKFFSIISHDLRGPISSFLNLTEILMNEMEELTWKELKDTMQMMNSSALAVNKLLNNLLQWSRLQRGKIDYSPDNYNLKFIIDNAIDLLKNSAFDKSIKIINLVPEDITVYSDSNMLDLIIRNLISNSIKFTNYEGTISIDSSIKNEKYISISVKDSGVGISPESISKLFKIDKIMSTQGTKGEIGSGLGLVLCKEFVEKNGGKISAKSTLGKGTTITFTLPLAQNY